MTEFKWWDYCGTCKDKCCYDEDIYASKSELQKLNVDKMENRDDGACMFFKDSKCSVYQDRPFECHVFPYDIIDVDGKLCWVTWDNCPVVSQLEAATRIKYFENNFPKKWDITYIKNYVHHHDTNEHEKYLDKIPNIIKEVEWK